MFLLSNLHNKSEENVSCYPSLPIQRSGSDTGYEQEDYGNEGGGCKGGGEDGLDGSGTIFQLKITQIFPAKGSELTYGIQRTCLFRKGDVLPEYFIYIICSDPVILR